MKLNYVEKEQDLFLMDKHYVLAHCVSEDCAMGAGIALEFRKRIPEMPDIVKAQNPKIGDAIPYTTKGGRIVVNLFTKAKYNHKPTYATLTKSLISFREYMKENRFTHIAIPLIGSGLDKLDWKQVSGIVQTVFANEDMEIVVCIKK